ncbi:hypothetical protein [Herbaspirillum huttiense]|uniref:hypothetical protein n=1 Tax=Herbaspirillum huttiense TaxID=863372 RepID=UPI0039B0998C
MTASIAPTTHPVQAAPRGGAGAGARAVQRSWPAQSCPMRPCADASRSLFSTHSTLLPP